MFEKRINAFFIFYQFSGSFANCPKTNVMPQRRRVHKTDQTHLELVPGKQTLKKDITKNDRHVRVLRNPRMRNLVSRPEVPPGDLFWCYYQEKTKGTSLVRFSWSILRRFLEKYTPNGPRPTSIIDVLLFVYICDLICKHVYQCISRIVWRWNEATTSRVRFLSVMIRTMTTTTTMMMLMCVMMMLMWLTIIFFTQYVLHGDDADSVTSYFSDVTSVRLFQTLYDVVEGYIRQIED